jgi:hypothetical protein
VEGADERNPALERAIPVRFVRDTVIANANNHLAGAATDGEHLHATGGARPDLVAETRCRDCVEHGPW